MILTILLDPVWIPWLPTPWAIRYMQVLVETLVTRASNRRSERTTTSELLPRHTKGTTPTASGVLLPS